MLHLQAINIPVQLVDPRVHRPPTWRQQRASHQQHCEGQSVLWSWWSPAHLALLSARKVLVLNVFILFVLWNKKHYLQDLVNYTCVDLDTLPLVLRQGDHHPEHHPINHVVSKLNIKACTIKTFWRPICRVNHSFMTPQNYSQSYQVCILKINKTVKNQPLNLFVLLC